MTSSILCVSCNHYKFLNKCDAFPEEIPKEILLGEIEHNKPLENQDNDIIFEPIKNKSWFFIRINI